MGSETSRRGYQVDQFDAAAEDISDVTELGENSNIPGLGSIWTWSAQETPLALTSATCTGLRGPSYSFHVAFAIGTYRVFLR